MLIATNFVDILYILNFAIFMGCGGLARPSTACRHSSPARPVYFSQIFRPGLARGPPGPCRLLSYWENRVHCPHFGNKRAIKTDGHRRCGLNYDDELLNDLQDNCTEQCMQTMPTPTAVSLVPGQNSTMSIYESRVQCAKEGAFVRFTD